VNEGAKRKDGEVGSQLFHHLGGRKGAGKKRCRHLSQISFEKAREVDWSHDKSDRYGSSRSAPKLSGGSRIQEIAKNNLGLQN